MDVICPGSTVFLNGKIEAFVNSVTIPLGEATYNCGWWNGNAYCTGDFYRKELTLASNQSTIKIGFNNA